MTLRRLIHPRSIRSAVFVSNALVAIIAIVVASVGLLQFYQRATTRSTQEYSTRLTELMSRNLVSVASSLAAYVGVYLDGNSGQLPQFPSTPNPVQPELTVHTLVQSMVYSTDAIDRVFLAGPGLAPYYFDRGEGAANGPQKRALAQFLAQNQARIRGWWGSPYWFTLPTDAHHIYLATAAYRNSIPEVSRIALVGIPVSYFENQYPQYRTIGGGALFVFNRLGAPVYGIHDHYLPIAKEVLRQLGTPSTPQSVVNAAGSNAVATIFRPPRQLLTFVTVVPQRELVRGVRTIRQILVGTGTFAALMAFFLAWLLSTGMTRDLVHLADRVQQITPGTPYRKVSISRRDEIGDLARSFNAMVDRLDETVRELTEEKAEKQQAELDAVEAEYRALQASVDPHFLNNILESINSIAKLNGQRQISDIVTSLSRVLRTTIAEERRLIPLEAELDYITNYLHLQAEITGRRITSNFEIDEETLSCMVPKLILQPVVENAVKYGLQEMESSGVLSIVAYLNGGLHIVVSDNGTGMPQATLQRAQGQSARSSLSNRGPRKGGFGIHSVRKRLELLYEGRAHFAIASSRQHGTRVEITLPVGDGL